MSKQTEMPSTPEWSHKIEVEKLTERATAYSFAASEQECRDLARRLNVIQIEGLKADGVITHLTGTHSYHVTGRVAAVIVQPCTASAEELRQVVNEPFEAWFANKDSAVSLIRARHDRLSLQVDAEVPILEEKDDPEPIVNGIIDLGEVAAQYLSLAIDPYPRKPGLELPVAAPAPEAGEIGRNPFAALKKWREAREK